MRMMMAIAALVALAGCDGNKDEPQADAKVEAPAAEPAAPSLATASKSFAWVCENDTPITAIQGTNAQGEPDLALIIEGRSFTMKQAMSASGVRYTTPDGLSEGKGLVWWEKGDQASLYENPSDKLDDAGELIRSCRPKE